MQRLAILALALATIAVWTPVPALTQIQNPCAAAFADLPARITRTATQPSDKRGHFGNDTRDVRDLLHLSSAASAERRVRAAAAVVRPMADRDQNNIAILEDNSGDLIIPPNTFDLANTGVRFEPSGSSYSVARASSDFRTPLGPALSLGDDASTSSTTIPFPFEFFGRRLTSLFVNSDGNITFEEADNASTERGLARLITGVPRIAPFFADLDPSAGGQVFLATTPDTMTVTWCAVPGFDSPLTMTAQATLLAGGSIEFRFGAASLGDGIVALSPGRTELFDPIDLSAATAPTAAASAFGEQFISSPSLDMVAAARRFYASHRDNFEQLVFWTDIGVISDAFAFHSPVRNAITGIGQPSFNFSAELGSGGSLEGVLNMDMVAKYGESPTSRLLGAFSPLGVLAHETGHRWLTHLRFLDADRQPSDALLGRQLAHWSFFMDSDGSVMEGNDIQDLGGGQFRTSSATEKFSRLDLYAMGLARPDEVPAWFYIDSPISSHHREDRPQPGASITGTRRDVSIQNVIDVMGPRVPAAADSPRQIRQAYIYVTRPANNEFLRQFDLRTLARMREEFAAFFSRATENRMTVRTTLTP
jgi:hypothetical protein